MSYRPTVHIDVHNAEIDVRHYADAGFSVVGIANNSVTIHFDTEQAAEGFADDLRTNTVRWLDANAPVHFDGKAV